MYSPPDPTSYNRLVWDIVRQIPAGRVSTYGQIASMIPPPDGVDELQYRRLGARWVGGAMHAVPDGSSVPWQRVINSKGEISIRERTEGHLEQRLRLEAEGVRFDDAGRVDFDAVGWDGPDADWLAERELLPPRPLGKRPSYDPDATQPRLF